MSLIDTMTLAQTQLEQLNDMHAEFGNTLDQLRKELEIVQDGLAAAHSGLNNTPLKVPLTNVDRVSASLEQIDQATGGPQVNAPPPTGGDRLDQAMKMLRGVNRV